MEITTHTTFHGLTVEQASKIVAVDVKFGVSMIKMVDHISETIKSMDAQTAARAASWFFEANAFAAEIAAKHNVSIEIAAGVISAVSPRMPWLRNKKVANAILADFRNYSDLSAKDAAKRIGMALSVNVAMAVTIARGGDIETVLTGTKRRSFYNNIVAPFTNNDVTVDTWMLMAFVNTTGTDKATALKYIEACDKSLGAGAGYFVIAESVREVAKEMGIKPHQTQALYWVCVSGDFDGARTDIN